jgi:hypothetical protein
LDDCGIRIADCGLFRVNPQSEIRNPKFRMSLTKILLCLDTDPQPSVFDAVVALDAGAEQLLRHGGVMPDDVRELVYGAMFTRGPDDLRHTAVFVGGSDVAAGEQVLAKVRECFFGPMRVSVMLDSNGANTTAAAAVLCARKHVSLAEETATVLAATGSVGRRVVRLFAREKAAVRVASRSLARAQAVCEEVKKVAPGAALGRGKRAMKSRCARRLMARA